MSSDGTKIVAGPWNGNIWTSTVETNVGSWVENTSIGSTKQGSDGYVGRWNKYCGRKCLDGNIWVSNNRGLTWREVIVGDGTNNWYGMTSSSDGTKLSAIVYGGNIWTSSNRGVIPTENTTTGAVKNWGGITASTDGTKLAAVVRKW